MTQGIYVRTALSPIEGLKLDVSILTFPNTRVRTALSPIEGLKHDTDREGYYIARSEQR